MPQPNDQLGPYILIQKLGSGQFGVVWKAQRRYGIAPPCAIKLPTDSEVKWEDVEKEARVWLHASGHPNVLPMIEANVYDEQIALVSEYAADGSLLDWLRQHGGKAPSVAQAIEMMSNILAGLEHLHRRNIIHRDLKPANILLQGDIPRLADFGLSRVLSSTQSTTPAGTLAYMSPEAFNGERNAQTDIWAAGVILYQLLTGRLPFPQRDMASLMNAIFMKLPEPLPPDLPEPLRSTVMQALEKTCERRYESAAAMREALLRPNATSQPLPVSPVKPITPQPAPYIAPRDVEDGLQKPPVSSIVRELETEVPKSPAKMDNSVAESFGRSEKRGIEKRKFALIFVAVVLALSLTAVYLNYRFTQNRGVLEQRLQGENQQLIQNLRTRIATLRTRANGAAEVNTQLNVLSQRLDEAAAMPATQYQQVGQACSEVGNAIYLLEQKQDGSREISSKLTPKISPTATVNASPTATTSASPSPSGTPSPAALLTGKLQVKVQIGSEPCWLKVWIDSNRPADGVLNPGDVREFTASEKMILSFGTVTGVSATLNGRPMKLTPTKGTQAYIVLTKDSYRDFLQ